MEKKMKILVSLLLIVVLVIAMVGCGGTQDSEKTSLEIVQERGTLLVGTEGAWPPFIYNDTADNNKLIGFEVEWAEKIAEKLGVVAEFNVSSQWDGVVAGLDANRYEVIFCAVAPTDYSADKYAFTAPYYKMRTVLVVDEDNEEIKTFEDLDGKIVGNSPQGWWGQYAKEMGAEVRNMSLVQAADNLGLDRIDATINAELSILDFLNTKPDAGIKIVDYYEPEVPEEEMIVAMLNQGNDELIAAINEAITAIIEEGTASELSIKYFGSDIYEGVEF